MHICSWKDIDWPKVTISRTHKPIKNLKVRGVCRECGASFYNVFKWSWVEDHQGVKIILD